MTVPIIPLVVLCLSALIYALPAPATARELARLSYLAAALVTLYAVAVDAHVVLNAR